MEKEESNKLIYYYLWYKKYCKVKSKYYNKVVNEENHISNEETKGMERHQENSTGV